MKIFKKVIYSINKTFGCCFFGMATSKMLMKNYEAATYMLFIVAILFMVGYFTEKWSSM